MPGGGGTLRAGVFGANDGLVSNTLLILGVAGAASDPRTVLITGVAGLLAGAFSMASGEYVSVRSQRELYEYQIGQERAELDRYPEEEAEELALIYAARGASLDDARKIARAMIANREEALKTLAREELGPQSGRSRLADRRGGIVVSRLQHWRHCAAPALRARRGLIGPAHRLCDEQRLAVCPRSGSQPVFGAQCPRRRPADAADRGDGGCGDLSDRPHARRRPELSRKRPLP